MDLLSVYWEVTFLFSIGGKPGRKTSSFSSSFNTYINTIAFVRLLICNYNKLLDCEGWHRPVSWRGSTTSCLQPWLGFCEVANCSYVGLILIFLFTLVWIWYNVCSRITYRVEAMTIVLCIYVFGKRGLSTPVSWRGSHMHIVVAAMAGLW